MTHTPLNDDAGSLATAGTIRTIERGYAMSILPQAVNTQVDRYHTPAQQVARRSSASQRASAHRLAVDLELEHWRRYEALIRQLRGPDYGARMQTAIAAGADAWRSFMDAQLAAERQALDAWATDYDAARADAATAAAYIAGRDALRQF